MEATDLPFEAIPNIPKGADLTTLKLGATEGFLLSRIDGKTDVRGLCALSGIGETDTKALICSLARSGVLVLHDRSGGVLAVGGNDGAGGIDANLKLQIEQILRGDQANNPYQVLQVEKGADARAVKVAYRRLAQEFHPDNFFGRDLGVWSGKIDDAFAAVNKAYEQLSDYETREKIDRRLWVAEGSEESSAPKAEQARARRKQSPLYQMIREKILKAKELAGEAEKALHHGDFVAAHSSYKLAATYDPKNEDYSRKVTMLEGRVAKVRASHSFKRARQLIDHHEEENAIPLLREVVNNDKSNAEARFELARILFPKMNRGGQTMKQEVRELAEAAAVLGAERPEYLLLAGRVLQALGDFDTAKEFYKATLKKDRKNEIAKMALKELKDV